MNKYYVYLDESGTFNADVPLSLIGGFCLKMKAGEESQYNSYLRIALGNIIHGAHLNGVPLNRNTSLNMIHTTTNNALSALLFKAMTLR